MNKLLKKQISLRLSNTEYEHIKQAAEEHNITVSNETKKRLKLAKNCMSTQEMIRMSEARMKRVIFNMLSAVADLKDHEILAAEKRFISIMRNGVKHEE